MWGRTAHPVVRWTLLAALLAGASAFPSCLQNPSPPSRPPVRVIPPPDWELVWSDEFDSAALDTTKWNYQLAFGCELGICGWGNHELQFYTDREKNVRLDSGRLILQAHRETIDSAFLARYPGYSDSAIEGAYQWSKKPDTFQHTSARITTKGKGDWKFGKIEVRARIPEGGDGSGCWPAIWLLPSANVYGGWPRSGEMDVMEAYGPNMDTIHQTFHWWGGEGTKGSYVQTAKAIHPSAPSADWSDDFHVYSLVWTPEKAVASIDGQAYVTRVNNGSVRQYPYIEEFHLILNIAIGGAGARYAPFSLTEFPQTMAIDYVRVYRDRNLRTDSAGT